LNEALRTLDQLITFSIELSLGVGLLREHRGTVALKIQQRAVSLSLSEIFARKSLHSAFVVVTTIALVRRNAFMPVHVTVASSSAVDAFTHSKHRSLRLLNLKCRGGCSAAAGLPLKRSRCVCHCAFLLSWVEFGEVGSQKNKNGSDYKI